MIHAMATTYPIGELCRTLGVSHSGYYAWRRGGRGTRARADRALSTQIVEMHRQSRGTYGSPRITRDLHAQGIRCGHNRPGPGTLVKWKVALAECVG